MELSAVVRQRSNLGRNCPKSNDLQGTFEALGKHSAHETQSRCKVVRSAAGTARPDAHPS